MSRRGSGRVGSGQQVLKSRGPCRVGSRSFQKSRGSGRVGWVKRFSNLTDWVGSDRVMRCAKCHGSGRVTITRELFSADPRVEHADLARASVFFKLAAACLPESHSRDPPVLPADPKLYNTWCFLPEGPSRGDTPNA